MSEHKSLAAALAAFQAEPDVCRFLTFVEDEGESGCWTWTGGTSRHGYGTFFAQGRKHVAHRWAVMAIGGRVIADGLVVDHLCRNKGCVNPSHLEVVTQRVNVLRGHNVNRAKTHCHNGHEFSPDNTRIRPRGGRTCLTCQRAYDRARYLASKEAAHA